jgi:hypothetical protein
MGRDLNHMSRTLRDAAQRHSSRNSRDVDRLRENVHVDLREAATDGTPAADADLSQPQRAITGGLRDAASVPLQTLALTRREQERLLRFAGWSVRQAKRDVLRAFPIESTIKEWQ